MVCRIKARTPRFSVRFLRDSSPGVHPCADCSSTHVHNRDCTASPIMERCVCTIPPVERLRLVKTVEVENLCSLEMSMLQYISTSTFLILI